MGKSIRITVNVIIAATLGIAVNYATSQNTSFLRPFLPFTWLAVGILMLLTIFVNLWDSFRIEQNGIFATFPFHKRHFLLTKMRRHWAASLESSLHHLPLLDLHVQRYSGSLNAKHVSHLFLAQTPIIQIYDNAGGDLLIIGEEGIGKTRLLFELTLHLFDRAIADKELPFPVILQPLEHIERLFLFPSWLPQKSQKLSVEDWITKTLQKQFKLSSPICQSLLSNGHMLLFVDGLHLLKVQHRRLYLDALSTYRKQHSIPLVICDRSINGFECFDFINSLIIEPFTLQNIYEYLLKNGGKFGLLHSILQQDIQLQQIITTPYMLHLLLQTFQNASSDTRVSSKQLARLVIEQYVVQKLQPQREDHPYTLHQMLLLLSQLAKGNSQYISTKSFSSIERQVPLASKIMNICIMISILFTSGMLFWRALPIFHGIPLSTLFIEAVALLPIGFGIVAAGVMRMVSLGSERRKATSNMTLTATFILLVPYIPLVVLLPEGWKTLPISLLLMFMAIFYIPLVIVTANFITKGLRPLLFRILSLWNKGTPCSEQVVWEYAVKRGILKKQEYEYRFVKQWLLDYFAAIDETTL